MVAYEAATCRSIRKKEGERGRKEERKERGRDVNLCLFGMGSALTFG